MNRTWPETIVFGQAERPSKMAGKRALVQPDSRKVFGHPPLLQRIAERGELLSLLNVARVSPQLAHDDVNTETLRRRTRKRRQHTGCGQLLQDEVEQHMVADLDVVPAAMLKPGIW